MEILPSRPSSGGGVEAPLIVTCAGGADVGLTWELAPGGSLVVGRGGASTLKVNDELASRRHGLLEATQSGVAVWTDASRNGTSYCPSGGGPGRVVLGTSVVVERGARITLGRTTLVVGAPDAAQLPQPPAVCAAWDAPQGQASTAASPTPRVAAPPASPASASRLPRVLQHLGSALAQAVFAHPFTQLAIRRGREDASAQRARVPQRAGSIAAPAAQQLPASTVCGSPAPGRVTATRQPEGEALTSRAVGVSTPASASPGVSTAPPSRAAIACADSSCPGSAPSFVGQPPAGSAEGPACTGSQPSACAPVQPRPLVGLDSAASLLHVSAGVAPGAGVGAGIAGPEESFSGCWDTRADAALGVSELVATEAGWTTDGSCARTLTAPGTGLTSPAYGIAAPAVEVVGDEKEQS